MNTSSCPISLISVDSNIARINAFYVGVLIIVFLLTASTIFVYFLILDFTTRIFFYKEFSLLYMTSKKTKELFKLESIKVDGAPKKLAAIFGLTFLVAIALVNFFALSVVMYLLSTVLLVCIILEVAFSYCLGCVIYNLYKKLFI